MSAIKAAIYLDSNAGAPLSPKVLEALLLFLQGQGGILPNPSSIHSHGRLAKRVLADARGKIALSLSKSIQPEQIIFTSSGSEANQLAIRSVFEPLLLKGKKPHWITTPVEHDSNRQMVDWLLARGGTVSYLPVNSQGLPLVDYFTDLLTPDTALVSLIWVNNETGVISPAEQISKLTRSHSVPLHLDAAQAWGKLPIQLNELGAQYVSFSGHKIGGLAGTGFLWVASGNPIHPLILGKQEKGRRGGTENLLGILALGTAAEQLNPVTWSNQVAPLRDQLESVICNRIEGTRVQGEGAPRVAGTLNLSFNGVDGDALIAALDLAGYSVSSGSACSSGISEPSPVLLAMGYTPAQAKGAVRISLSHQISWTELEGFVDVLEGIIRRIRSARTN